MGTDRGYTRMINGRILGVCSWCGKIVRVDKPFVGSLHLCTDGRESQAEIDRRVAANTAILKNAT